MSKGYLLDTCAWLDLNIAPELLSTQAKAIIRKTDHFALSSISVLEVSRKASLGKLTLIGIPATLKELHRTCPGSSICVV